MSRGWVSSARAEIARNLGGLHSQAIARFLMLTN